MTARHSAKIKKWHVIHGLILTLAVLFPEQGQADSTVKLHGTLMAANCSPDAINVEFGDVSLDKISTTKNLSLPKGRVRSTGASMQQFVLSLNCSGNINEIKYKWSGTTSSFNNELLATDIQGLAIEMGDADTASLIPPDQWQSLAKDVRSKNLLAIIIRDSDTTFVGGEFNAIATFTIQVP